MNTWWEYKYEFLSSHFRCYYDEKLFEQLKVSAVQRFLQRVEMRPLDEQCGDV